MRKHLMALSFALIGLSVSGLYFEYTGVSMALGLCIGGFVGYFISGLITAKSVMLQQDFAKLGDVSGKSLEEIVSKVGNYTSYQVCTIADRDNEQGFFYTWIENSYSITLLFDSQKKCIGVNSETRG